MPGNAFIKFLNSTGTAIPGESMQESHPAEQGWLEISDWGFDIEAETNFLKGTGAAVGVATPTVLNFTHSFDKSSPQIMKNIVMGTSFQSVAIHMLKSTGATDGKPEVFFAIKCKDAFITKVASKGGEDGAVTQDVEFVFKAITIGYKRQLDTGKLDKAPKEFGWNVSERSLSPGIKVTMDPKSE